MRAKSSTPSCSPRACGSTPAAASAASAAAADPAIALSVERSVLRRWAKAASTTDTSRLVAVVLIGSTRRVRDTSPLSTLGAGQKTLRPMAPARLTSAYQLAFTDGTPYTFEPGGAASRSATSDCTITRPCRSDGSSAMRCSRTGTDTL